jgi:hypothetical protein
LTGNGRFQVVDAPALAPGVDFVTRSTIGPFIDTRVDLSIGKIDRGRVYLSKDTVREMATELGLFDELREQALASETDIYNRGYAEAVQENHADRIRSAALDLADLAGQLLAYAPAAAEAHESTMLAMTQVQTDSVRAMQESARATCRT